MTPEEAQGSIEGAAAAEPTAASATATSGLTPAMRNVVIVVGAIVATGLLIAAWLFTTGGGAPGASPSTSQSRSPSPSTSPAPTPGPIPGATPTTGSEVQPPSATESPGSGLPPLPAQTPLVTPPLPASGSASGELVEGFPESIMGPAPGSDVLSSSIATEGETMQVTLVARTDAPADDIRDHYRQQWAALGLTESVSAGADAAYIDSFTSLTLAFSPASGTGTIYMVYGVFRTS